MKKYSFISIVILIFLILGLCACTDNIAMNNDDSFSNATQPAINESDNIRDNEKLTFGEDENNEVISNKVKMDTLASDLLYTKTSDFLNSFTIIQTTNSQDFPFDIRIGDSFEMLSVLYPNTYKGPDSFESGGYVFHAISQYDYSEIQFVPVEKYPRMILEFEEGTYLTAIRIEYKPAIHTQNSEDWIKDLYNTASLLIAPFEFGSVDFDSDDCIIVNDSEYYRITSENLADYDTFKSVYGEVFTDHFLAEYTKGKSAIIYLDDGKGYFVPTGRGSSINVGDVIDIFMKIEENQAVMIVRVEELDIMDFENVIGYKEYLFDLVNENDVWKFDTFSSIR